MATDTPFVNSISVAATPTIIAADSGVTSSTLVATVRDQFNAAMAGKVVNFAEDDSSSTPGYIRSGYLSGTTDSNGQVTSYYHSGNQANLVTITVTVNQ